MKKTIHLLGILLILVFNISNSYAVTKVLRMGVDVSSLPFIYIDSNGEVIGFEVELIKEIGKLKGFDVEIVPDLFPRIFDHLAEKQIDFIGHIYYSEERAQKYLLSNPYYVDKLQIAALKNNDESEDSDLLSKNITISTLAHSPLAKILLNLNKDHPNIQNSNELTTFLAFKALFMKKADALLATETGIHLYTNNYNQYQYKAYPMPAAYPQELPICFLTLSENAELIQQINDGIEQIKSSPLYQELKEKYRVL